MFSMPKPESDELYEHELIRSSSPVSDTTSTLLSFSEPPTPSITVNNSNSNSNSSSQPKPKRHLSFRGLKSKRVGIMSDETTPTEKVTNLSDGESLEATKPKKKKNRAIKLIKKLSLRKKHKVGPKADEATTSDGGHVGGGGVSSTATTPGSIKRRTPEGATLSMSEGSLHMEQETSGGDPLKKAETVQITISSKKIEKVNQAESYAAQRSSDRVSPGTFNNTNSAKQQQFVFESHNELVEANPAATAPITAMTEIKTTISNANAKRGNNNDYISEQTLILLEKESTSNPISAATNMSEPTTTSASSDSATVTSVAAPTTTKIIETTTTTRTEQIEQIPPSLPTPAISSATKPVVLAGIEKEANSKVDKVPTTTTTTTSDEDRVGQIVASIVLAQSKLAPSILINKSSAQSEANFMKTSDEAGDTSEAPPSPVDENLKVRVLEANDPVQLGNSLKNRNFTPFISVPSTSLHIREERDAIEPEATESDTVEADIKFDIGTSVRPLRTSESEPRPQLQHSESIENTDSNSLDSLSPPTSETGARRRIAYIQQKTLYTSQEKAQLFRTQETSLASELKMAGAAGMSPLEFPIPTTSETEKIAVNDNDDDDDADADDNEDEIANNMNPEKREHLYKILVIGELGTGKTSFIKRYVHQFFSQNYRATIGVDFALKVLNWDQDTIIRLQLWDIAGQERFGNMTRVYYKEAVGAFIVFDVTRSATFDAVIKWKQDLDSKVQLADGSPIPCILLANKCDQTKQGIVTTPAKLDEYVKDHGFAGWFETSAKDNINIEDAAKALVNKILANEKLANPTDLVDPERIALNGKADTVKKSCVC